MSTYVKDFGGTGEVLVLLHGFLASSAYWRRLQPRLSAAGYRVITIDLLGFGNAPKPDHAAYTYQDHLEHIKTTLETHHIHEPFLLVGHSMGALLALRFARLYPHKVAALTLLHPPLYTSTRQALATLYNTGWHYRLLLDSKLRAFAWGALRLLPIGMSRMKHTKRSREKSLEKIVLAAEGLNDLKHIATSTLLVLGSKDRKIYINNLKAAAISNQVRTVVQPVPHHSPFLHSTLIFQTIHYFHKPATA